MEKKTPRIYTYKITFEETRHYYYGVHKEKKFGEEYWGSPVTHKWMWEFYTPQKQVLELFDFSDEGYTEADKVEKRLIRPVYNTDPLCLNENCGGRVSLEAARKNGLKCKENGIGFFKMTKEQRRRVAKKNEENGIGIHKMTPEQKSEAGKIGGKIAGKISGRKNYENGIGCFKFTPEERREISRKGGLKVYENKIGIHKRTKEEMREHAIKINSQKWQCTVTGHVSNAGALSRYQKARGIDTSNRIRLE
jgi:hypothetical protein